MRSALVLALLVLADCKYFRKDPGRVLVRASSDELEAHTIDGKRESVFVGARDALPYANGAGTLVIDKVGTMSRVEPKRSGVIECSAGAKSTLLAVDDSGNRVLFKSEDETLHFMDVTTCAETKLAVRYAYRGDVARDGSEAAVGAFPTSCTATLNACPIVLYRLRLPGSPVPTEVLRSNTRAHYQPRYFPDGKLLFQTTERDASCDGTVDHCRHDIVSVPIASGPGAIPELVREGAIAAGVSNDGKRIAYLAYFGDADCHKVLPCKSMTLKVGDWRTSDDSKDVAIGSGTVSNVPGHPFSLDGRYVAFATGTSYEPQTCQIDGTHCKTYAGHLVGWMK